MELGLRLRALAGCRATLSGFPAAAAHGRGCRQPRRGASSSAPCSLAASASANGAAAGPVGSGVEVARAKRMLHVVLVSPMIPGNTGSIARTCAASAVGLHLVGPLGYNVDDTKLKRAGLDYWPYPILGAFHLYGTHYLRNTENPDLLIYWSTGLLASYVVVKVHDSWDEFRDYFMKQDGDKRLLAFTKRGANIHSDFSYKPGDWLVFGSETKGLPDNVLEDCSGEAIGGGTIRIPMVETYVRCLNLSVSVGVALYEAARQLNYEQLQYQPYLPEDARGLFPAEDIYG